MQINKILFSQEISHEDFKRLINSSAFATERLSNIASTLSNVISSVWDMEKWRIHLNFFFYQIFN